MLNHVWSVLCRRSIVDGETNNLSIYDVLEQLGLSVTVPDDAKDDEIVTLPIEFEVVSLWTRADVNFELKTSVLLEIITPTGEKIKDFEQELIMPAGMKRLRTRLRVFGLAIKGSGNYLFVMKVKEEKKGYAKVAEIPLEINLTKQKETSKTEKA